MTVIIKRVLANLVVILGFACLINGEELHFIGELGLSSSVLSIA